MGRTLFLAFALVFFFSLTQVGWTVEMSKRTLLYKRHHLFGISQPAFPESI